MSKKQILKEVNEYIDYLEKPSENFGGMPVCPFVKSERKNNKLMIEVWKPNKKPFLELLEKFKKSEYSSALFVCEITDGLNWKDVDRAKFQKAIQILMKEKGFKGLKAICLSPFEEWKIAEEDTREKAPYFLINIGSDTQFDETHRTLWKTDYFMNFSEEELDKMKVYPKNKKLDLNEEK